MNRHGDILLLAATDEVVQPVLSELEGGGGVCATLGAGGDT